MISDRFRRVSRHFTGDFGRNPLRQICRISLLILALGSFGAFGRGAGSGVIRTLPKARNRPRQMAARKAIPVHMPSPRKRTSLPRPRRRSGPRKIEGMPDYSIHVDVPVVEVPVMVTTKDGQFISNLKKDNFRISEDGTPQKITNFTISEAPITAVLLVEFCRKQLLLHERHPACVLRVRQHFEEEAIGWR